MTSDLLSQSDTGVLQLTLNRPDRRNALSASLIAALTTALQDTEADPAIRCAIITGAGPAFCAGLDLDEVRAIARTDGSFDVSHLLMLYQTITHLGIPVIAAVNGPAVAGGAALVTVCDLAICTPAARFGYPGIRQGIIAPIVVPPLLHAASGPRARHLLLTGDLIDADRMFAWGLVSQVVAPDELLHRAHALAQQVAAAPRAAVARTKTDIFNVSGRWAECDDTPLRTIHLANTPPDAARSPRSD